MNDDETPEPRSPEWETVYLVCRACAKRANGPKRVEAKALAGVLPRK